MKIDKLLMSLVVAGAGLGFATTVHSGAAPQDCPTGAVLEVNAFRGGSPALKPPNEKKITAKARIVKGTAAGDTTCPGTITITNDLTAETEVVNATFVVGKGGQGGNTFFDFSAECPANDGTVVTFTATAESSGATPGVRADLQKTLQCP